MRISDWSSDVCSSDLFARNERLACHFDTDFGPMAVVMVGALLVSGIETVWSGEEIPAYGNAVTVKDYRGGQDGEPVTLERFEEMARFNYGSTVIVLLPAGIATLESGLVAESPVRLGQARARLGSEGHTSELQSLMRRSYAGFCLKKKTHKNARMSSLNSPKILHINASYT